MEASEGLKLLPRVSSSTLCSVPGTERCQLPKSVTPEEPKVVEVFPGACPEERTPAVQALPGRMSVPVVAAETTAVGTDRRLRVR